MNDSVTVKSPKRFIIICVAIAALCFLYALLVGMNGNPKDRVGLLGFPVGLFALWIAYTAHRRPRVVAVNMTLEIPEEFPPVTLIVKPLYSLFEEAQPITRLGQWWSNNTHGYREVIGFTNLGSVFLRNPETGVYAILWPLRIGRNASTLEKCESVADFEARFLKDREHSPVILDPIKVAALRKDPGPLEPGQVYIPVPYPMIAAMSGNKTPPTWDRGDFWNFINLCGQLTGKLSG
ncbi:hypothetical protein BWI17_15660 [Betaproteobacteria bacterium GR16-43]|nr:hypothetical protein BWI17_15660 [Betaproteobacteria bacterium GR16-43]